MAILAALMTAIAAAEFVLLIVMAGNRSDSARVAEFRAALDYAVEHVGFSDRMLFICAYRNGDEAVLQQRFPTWKTFRDHQVAIAMEQLGHAEDDCEAILGDVKTAAHNAADGAALASLGGIRDGRTLKWACRLILTLVNLRGNPERDHALTQAARQWLQAMEGRS